MPRRTLVWPDAYYDSVTLMAVSRQVAGLPGVVTCLVAMATEMNKELLHGAGLLTPAAAAASAADLVIAAEAASEAALDAACAQVEGLLRGTASSRAPAPGATGAPGAGGPGVAPPPGATGAPRTIAGAVRAVPTANLALISVPGPYAAREARLALEHGLHVMLFSDNVPLEAEQELKRLAHGKGLLLMGPDCGTAVLNGVGLGFANAVRRGPIGIVAASGTGAQELSTLIDRLGSGVSQLIGTGGRDLSEAVGGLMTLDGIALLQEDPDTRVIVVAGKPPAPAVAEKVVQRLQAGGKPHVVCLPGAAGALSMDEAAVRAVALATGAAEADLRAQLGYGEPVRRLPVAAGRRYVRGLFSGGTLCAQALRVLEPALGPVTCNVHPDPGRRGGARQAQGHTLVDLGADEFTAGRPHPMIDPTLRRQRLLAEARDPEVAVILLDLVIGYGSHPDPAAALADAIREAASRGIAVLASVTGTEADPQRRSSQVAALQAAGATVLPTARLAALTAAATAMVPP